jgi:hypothetical protein
MIRYVRYVITIFAALACGSPCLAQSSVSLFTNAVPAVAAVQDTAAQTLGVKFWSTQPGTISGIRFFRGAKSKKGYTVGLYSATGTKLASAHVGHDTSPVPGWHQVNFSAPISITANTTYVATYYSPQGQYAKTQYGLQQTATTGPLNAPAGSTVGGNGVSRSGASFPTAGTDDTNYFVDVVFTPSPNAPVPNLSIVLTPTNPTIPANAPLGSLVAAVTAKWSDGSPFTGAISFGPPNSNAGGIFAIDKNQNLIINPSGPGVGSAGGSIANVTIVATQ